jgi:hypothetical protein
MSEPNTYDPKRWRKGLDVNKAESVDELDAYISWKIKIYTEKGWRDDYLWEYYQEDFNTFTKEVFTDCDSTLLRELRDILRTNGVYVKRARGVTIAKELFAVLEEQEQAEWPKEEIQKQITAPGGFNSAKNPAIQQRFASTAPPTILMPPILPHAPPYHRPSPTPEPQDHIQRFPSEGSHDQGGRTGFGYHISQIAKFYPSDDNKYGGTNDNFDRKLTIFHDICDRTQLPPEARARAFPTMLKGLALDRYYSTCTNRGYSLDEICRILRCHFEGPEYKRNVISKWDSTTFQSIIDKNEGKSTEDCLQLLIEQLTHLQHGLDPEYRTEKHLLNKLVNACQDVPACEYACCKPAETLSGFINDLQSSIHVHDKKKGSSTTFFTDRRYYHQNHRSQPLQYN